MRYLKVLIPLLLILSVPAHASGKRVALVIGNAAYTDAVALVNPKNDAADMAAALKAVGFTVILGIDLTKTQMDRKILQFSGALSGADAGVFYYSGHGLQVAGVNYLVPIDAELTSPAALDFEMVRLDLVQRTMEREAKTNILFLDACRNNPLARNLARALGTRSMEIGRGLAPTESGAGTLISFSTQPGNVALDGSERNSPFTGPLANAIGTSSEDILSILTAVRNEVMAATKEKQVPWENNALRAKFYFSPIEPSQPKSASAEPQPPLDVRDYLLKNPEVLLEVQEAYEKKVEMQRGDATKSRLPAFYKTLDSMKPELAGMSVGKGDVTVVQFFDYNCGYCRKGLPDLVKLIETGHNIRVQFLEFPILAPESKEASKVAIAAAKQGKYYEFHKAMFATGRASKESALMVARQLGLDMARVQADMASPETDDLIAKIAEVGKRMLVDGTPTFVIGDKIHPGWTQFDQFEEFVAEARKEGCKACAAAGSAKAEKKS